MLTRQGEFVPIEVKRTATGLTDHEVEKLDALAQAMGSPWTGVAACQYARDTGDALDSLSTRNVDGTHDRLVLAYDRLLQPHPMWALGDDPFAEMKLGDEEIAKREKEFVASLVMRSKEADVDWLAYSMVRRRTTADPAPPLGDG